MGSRGYGVVSENGDHIDGASEDALFEMISELNDTDNTFIVVEPDTEDPTWFASVAVLEGQGFEIACRDPAYREHKVHTDTNIGRIALDLIVWLAARNLPGQPARPVPEI
ncbi:hypothetical protein [Streptomyces sp. NPDC050264]|uniref:hypothetical protein n=1 Tax=Streptomyces sp. NPDC050264 TaxID=3155038 RepID=UPI00341AC274